MTPFIFNSVKSVIISIRLEGKPIQAVTGAKVWKIEQKSGPA